MNCFRKITALFLMAVMLVPCMTGCKKEPTTLEEFELGEEDLPYGATMKSNKTSYAVPVTYDRRFVTEEQVSAVADLCASIQNQDGELYQKITPEGYADYQINEVYSYASADEMMQALHTSVANNTGEDFKFSMVMVNGISDNRELGGLMEAIALMDNLTENAFSPSLLGAWDFTLEWDFTYDEDAKSTIVDEQHIFVFQTENGYYAMM
ncbi:MAG: hypothetical protein V3G42_01630 [Oscillospiraceae bacterium]